MVQLSAAAAASSRDSYAKLETRAQSVLYIYIILFLEERHKKSKIKATPTTRVRAVKLVYRYIGKFSRNAGGGRIGLFFIFFFF